MEITYFCKISLIALAAYEFSITLVLSFAYTLEIHQNSPQPGGKRNLLKADELSQRNMLNINLAFDRMKFVKNLKCPCPQ